MTLGGLIKTHDLEDYESEMKPGLRAHITDDLSLCGSQPPSVYPLVQLAIAAALGKIVCVLRYN